MTVPNGSPAWTRSADATVYGGHPDKRDYQGQGVVNPQTDISAAEFLRMTADLAAVVRVAPFAVLRIQCDDTTPNDPTVLSVNQQTGIVSTSYAGMSPPTGFPTAERNGDGDITITWDSDYPDEFGEIAPVALRMGMASVTGSGAGEAVVEMVSDTAIRVRAFDDSGVALQDTQITVEVWT